MGIGLGGAGKARIQLNDKSVVEFDGLRTTPIQSLLGKAVRMAAGRHEWARSSNHGGRAVNRYLLEKRHRVIICLAGGVFITALSVVDTVYKNGIDYQQHPVASIIGSSMSGCLLGVAYYWWVGWRARRKHELGGRRAAEKLGPPALRAAGDSYGVDGFRP